MNIANELERMKDDIAKTTDGNGITNIILLEICNDLKKIRIQLETGVRVQK